MAGTQAVAGVAERHRVYNGSAEPNYTLLAQTAWDPAAESLYASAYKSYVTANAYNPSLATSLVKRSGYTSQTLTLAILSGDATQLAVAAAPRLLILDEAVAALDVSVQAQVLNLLADLRAADGLTSVFISHDLGVVRQVSSHCVVMHRGVIVERGSTDQILDAPAHPYTKRLLAAVPRPGWTPRVRSAPPGGPATAEPKSPLVEPERTR
jgi:ABC-type cobalamin transport system ATPase subunit